MTRIFIIDDHPLIITGLKAMFRSKTDGLWITGSAKNIDQTLETANPEEIDIFLLDPWIAETPPLTNVRKLQESYPGKPIVILTTEESLIWKRRMIAAGVHGYLAKSSDKATIKYTLNKVGAGEDVFSLPFDKSQDNILKIIYSNELEEKITLLQHEYVVLVSEGYTHQQIADKHGYSLSSVDKAFKLLRKKFNVKNNNELVGYMFKNRFI